MCTKSQNWLASNAESNEVFPKKLQSLNSKHHREREVEGNKKFPEEMLEEFRPPCQKRKHARGKRNLTWGEKNPKRGQVEGPQQLTFKKRGKKTNTLAKGEHSESK